MTTQKIKIDVTAYLYTGYENCLDNFFENVKKAIANTNRYSLLDMEKTNEGIHFTSEFDKDIQWIVDDEFNYTGSGHYTGVINQSDFMYYFDKFLKSADTDGCYCELEDYSDFRGN